MNKKKWDSFEKAIQKEELNSRFNKAPCIAILTGPTIMIEAWVYIASKKSGIDMDWGFIGGRACVYALGDSERAYQAICENQPFNMTP